MTCSRIVQWLMMMTCSCLFPDFFMTCSWLVLDLFIMTCSWHVDRLILFTMTNLSHVHDICFFIMACSWHVHDLFLILFMMTCSWLVCVMFIMWWHHSVIAISFLRSCIGSCIWDFETGGKKDTGMDDSCQQGIIDNYPHVVSWVLTVYASILHPGCNNSRATSHQYRGHPAPVVAQGDGFWQQGCARPCLVLLGLPSLCGIGLPGSYACKVITWHIMASLVTWHDGSACLDMAWPWVCLHSCIPALCAEVPCVPALSKGLRLHLRCIFRAWPTTSVKNATIESWSDLFLRCLLVMDCVTWHDWVYWKSMAQYCHY